MKKRWMALVLVAAMVLALVPMTAMAAEITISAGGTEKANGDALKAAIKAASDGDVILLEEGIYDTSDGIITRTDKTMPNITIRGKGVGKTIIKGSKYRGFTPQHDDPNSVAEVTIEEMTIQGVRQPIYVKGNITVTLRNVKLENIGTSTIAILLDSCNVSNDGQFHDGITTTVNTYGVTIEEGDTVEINANPTNNGGEYAKHTTYGGVNIYEGCNFDISDCKPQSPNLGVNNAFVNGQSLNSMEEPSDQSAKAGESATFSVAGTGVKSCQWYVDRGDGKGFVAIDGATSATYTTAPLTEENNGYRYYCLINGVVESEVVTLRLAEPAPIPETGDGMGLFVFAGLALVSMLGMVMLKKREQF